MNPESAFQSLISNLQRAIDSATSARANGDFEAAICRLQAGLFDSIQDCKDMRQWLKSETEKGQQPAANGLDSYR